MRHPSIRGIGIRYVLALTLPVTGIVLVLYTVVQLLGFGPRDPRAAAAQRRAPLQGSLGPGAPASPTADAPTAPSSPAAANSSTGPRK